MSPRFAVVGGLAAAAILSASACGSSTSASASTTVPPKSGGAAKAPGGDPIAAKFAASPALQQAFASFASCMDAHGYPNFPTTYAAAVSSVNLQSAAFANALGSCDGPLKAAEHAAGFGPGSGTGIGGGPFAPGGGNGAAGSGGGGGNGGGGGGGGKGAAP